MCWFTQTSTLISFSLILLNCSMKEALYAQHTAALYAQQTASISFTNDDMLIGTSAHNRLLYVTGVCDTMRINRILVDPGSSINLLSLNTLKSLSFSVRRLSTEKISIHGFDHKSRKALGAITLPLKFGDLETEAQFDVIDAETSYKALLGRPWLHENLVVPSTLHQCMKYIKDDEQRRIDDDIAEDKLSNALDVSSNYSLVSHCWCAPKRIPFIQYCVNELLGGR